MMAPERDVELYGILWTGELHQYRSVKVVFEDSMPSGGEFSNPADKQLVQGLEDAMISAFGKSVAIAACRKGTQTANLEHKMIRGEHLPTLFVAARDHGVTGLNLAGNQLRVSGAETLGTLMAWDKRIISITCVAIIASHVHPLDQCPPS